MTTSLDRGRIDALFEKHQRPGSPGCAVALLAGGEILYQQGYGLANVEHGIPITPTTRFNIASEAKQFTALAILLLAQAGAMSLDDNLHRHLPEAPDFGETITIRHLIHHTSGVRCSFPPLLLLGGWLESDVVTNEDVYRLFLAQRELNFRPGTEFSYANMGYSLLARIVARASGRSFAAFCREEIFEPLGMFETIIQDDPMLIVPDRAQSYWRDERGRLFNSPLADGVCGPTNIYTSVADLALWDENFYSGRVGGKALVAQMQQPGRLNSGQELNYAFGLMVGPAHSHRGYRLVEHGGGHGGYVSALIRFPDIHFSVAVLGNVFTWETRREALRLADVYLDGLAGAKGRPPERNDRAEDAANDATTSFSGQRSEPAAVLAAGPLAELQEYAGQYWCPELNVYWNIVPGDDHLGVKRQRYPPTRLQRLSVDRFDDDWSAIAGYPLTYSLRFERDAAGVITGFRVSGERLRHLLFVRQEVAGARGSQV